MNHGVILDQVLLNSRETLPIGHSTLLYTKHDVQYCIWGNICTELGILEERDGTIILDLDGGTRNALGLLTRCLKRNGVIWAKAEKPGAYLIHTRT